jgi:L-2-hydroxyglutarate oxidase LhgO
VAPILNIAIIGSGIVGLSLARHLILLDHTYQIAIYDSFSIPSKGTSKRNSGVLHAGLYYQPGSLKSKLCQVGRNLLQNYINENSLPILSCGKILVPHTSQDFERLSSIYTLAEANGCSKFYIDYKDANSIQPGICKRDMYLWSPNTSVFCPSSILQAIVCDLLQTTRVSFFHTDVSYINPDTTVLLAPSPIKYDFIFNVAGPGALKLFKQISNDLNHLLLVPFIGEYARLKSGPKIKTNLYPVPDPELPFLGIHVTPTTTGAPIIGPNALPFFRSYIDEYIPSDLNDFVARLSVLSAFFLSNRSNFRSHALHEFTLRKAAKFKKHFSSFFRSVDSLPVDVSIDVDVSGIRPQLVNIHTLSFVNDFICVRTNNVLHVVNAVSPAFTSSFGLAQHLSSLMV